MVKTVFGTPVYETVDEMAQTSHTALVLVDTLNDFYHPDGHFGRLGLDLGMMSATIPAMKVLLESAREAGVMVVHVQNTVLPGGASDSGPFIRFKDRALSSLPEYTIKGTWGGDIIDELKPVDGELVAAKHRPSGFVNTNLEQLLRIHNIESVVIAGCATEGCIQSTAVDALFLDFYPIVCVDCVATYDQGRHDAALKYMAPRVELCESESVIKVWQ